MKRRLRIAWLPDGKRLHLRDGSLDLIIQAFGRPGDIARAYDAAITRMRGLLDEITGELEMLRRPAPRILNGSAARRMNAAVSAFWAQTSIMPLAAFTGAAADDVLAAMQAAATLERAYVNNNGDIALHLGHGQSFSGTVVDLPGHPRFAGKILIEAQGATRGVATTGWKKPGFSLGIADAVTVGAVSAAAAAAAATAIGNAIDLPGHKGISRAPANTLNPESDLRGTLVTTNVANLSLAEKAAALAAGASIGRVFLKAGLITGAALYVQGEVAFISSDPVKQELRL
jgi:ApbE superfamily uncharacterized protein (UPF0280 family)